MDNHLSRSQIPHPKNISANLFFEVLKKPPYLGGLGGGSILASTLEHKVASYGTAIKLGR
jgi:hypothetical protein